MGTAVSPLCVVDAWQRGVVLRFGKFHRTINPGLHFVIPLAEHVVLQSVVTTTTTLSAQTVKTPDNKLYTLEAVVRWSVSDAEAFTVKIWDGANVVVDCCKGAIAKSIREYGVDDIDARINKAARQSLEKYGIRVEFVTLTTIAQVKVFRLIANQITEPITQP